MPKFLLRACTSPGEALCFEPFRMPRHLSSFSSPRHLSRRRFCRSSLCFCSSGIVDGSFHLESWREGDVERSEKDLGYQVCKIDRGVVDVAVVPRDPALFEPHLKTSVNCEEEFGGEFFVEGLFGFEYRSLAFNHRLQGAKTLGADAELAKEDVICDGKHFYLHHHVVNVRWRFHFLFV